MNNSGNFQRQGFWKKRSLGQNFLINPHIVSRVVSAAKITKNDTIVEVGPGLGNLTQKLAEKSKKVIAIEKDSRLISILKNNLSNYGNVDIIEGDILKIDTFTLLPPTTASYKIVANIPYYITSHFLRKIFVSRSKASGELAPQLVILTIQKEVAQRIMARPPHMNLLALSIQYYSTPEIISYISKNNFRPIPKVDSAIIRLISRSKASGNTDNIYTSRSLASGSTPGEGLGGETEELFKLMRLGFSEKRKQLASVLSKKLKIDKEKILESFQKEGIAPKARAENLSLEQWQKLSKIL